MLDEHGCPRLRELSKRLEKSLALWKDQHINIGNQLRINGPNQLTKYPLDSIPAHRVPKSSTDHNTYSAFRAFSPAGEHVEEWSRHPPTVLFNVFDVTARPQEHSVEPHSSRIPYRLLVGRVTRQKGTPCWRALPWRLCTKGCS